MSGAFLFACLTLDRAGMVQLGHALFVPPRKGFTGTPRRYLAVLPGLLEVKWWLNSKCGLIRK